MNRVTLFVDVILPLPVKGFFTYRVPFEINDNVAIGKRVVVQFGRKKIYTALIHSIHQIPPTKYIPKYILSVLDKIPIVNEIQYKFWEWLASYYMAYSGDVMNASLPGGLKLQSESKIVLNQEFNKDYSSLSEKEFLVAEAVDLQEEITLSDVSRIIGQAKVIPLIKTLIEKKIIVLKQELIEQYKPKIETYLRLTKEFQQEEMLHQALDDLSKRAYKQMELLLSYINLTS
ncbi:MAG: primosomal protein N', partial [Candidatus Atribacteria bacterium]|nr:primosomal protein N' [Candidatus Atribacteria bacterium]